MKYYLVTVDANYVAPVPVGWYGKIDRKSRREKKAYQMEKHLIFGGKYFAKRGNRYWAARNTDYLRRAYMAYMDEKILEKKEEIKKERYCSLEDGVYMDGKVMKFERVELLEALSIVLPDTMKQMSEIYAKSNIRQNFARR